MYIYIANKRYKRLKGIPKQLSLQRATTTLLQQELV